MTNVEQQAKVMEYLKEAEEFMNYLGLEKELMRIKSVNMEYSIQLAMTCLILTDQGSTILKERIMKFPMQIRESKEGVELMLRALELKKLFEKTSELLREIGDEDTVKKPDSSRLN